MSDLFTELQAVLMRAADQEARRQAAQQRGDRQAEAAAEAELRKLWRRHGELEEQTQ